MRQEIQACFLNRTGFSPRILNKFRKKGLLKADIAIFSSRSVPAN